MKKKKKQNVKLNFDQQLEKLKKDLIILEERIALFEEYGKLREYFSKTKKSQNSYITEIRKIIATEMREKGFTFSDIGKIFSKDHSTIMNLFRLNSDPRIQKEVIENYKDWIANNFFPETISIRIPSADHPTGWGSIITYKLVNI
jgi:hypothetical protein